MHLPELYTRFRVEAAAVHMFIYIAAHILCVLSVGIKLFVLAILYTKCKEIYAGNDVKSYMIREMSLFSEYFVPLRFSLCMEIALLGVFSSRVVFFTL